MLDTQSQTLHFSQFRRGRGKTQVEWIKRLHAMRAEAENSSSWKKSPGLKFCNAASPNSTLSSLCILYPYTAERRDVLENTLPEAQEISQGRGFCTPRPERLPEGEARGQSRGPSVFSNASRLEAVYGHSFRISREVLILWCDNRWL